jgi:hypothetical protein
MGEFVTMTALRNVSPAEAADAVVRFARDNGISAAVAGDRPTGDFATIYPPAAGWTIIYWPRAMLFTRKASRWMSEQTGTLASVIDLFDSDSWTHVAYLRGRACARFASDPAGHTSDLTSLEEAQARWRGDPGETADVFGVDAAVIAPYLRTPPPDSQRAFPGDESPLGDPWVVVDFWRRLGITFPRGASREDGAAKFVQFPEIGYPPPIYDTSLD